VRHGYYTGVGYDSAGRGSNKGADCPGKELMKNEKLFIEGFSDARARGVTLHFNRPTNIQLGGVESKTWFVSWDKVGTALCGQKYTGNDN
jgi:hypothetical protein